jgi:hypothetical protein
MCPAHFLSSQLSAGCFFAKLLLSARWGLKFCPKLRVLKTLEAKILQIRMLFRTLRGADTGIAVDAAGDGCGDVFHGITIRAGLDPALVL